MRRALVFMVLAGNFLSLSACSLLNEREIVPPSIDISDSTVVINNHSSQRIYYFIGDEDVLARINIIWKNQLKWPSIAAHQSVEVPFEDIYFFSESTNRLRMKWTTDRKDSGSIRTNIQNVQDNE